MQESKPLGMRIIKQKKTIKNEPLARVYEIHITC